MFEPDELNRLKDMLILYGCALKTMTAKLDVIYEDFKSFHANNPIDYVTGRIKTPESISEKLNKKNLVNTCENAEKHLTDIAGIRVICHYSRDIYNIAQILKNQPDLTLICEKDYVTNPKPSGYRSFHLIFSVPVHLTEKTTHIPVEVQIRTVAMNFWASLEHKVRYKYKEQIPKHLSDELVACAEKISELDNRMFLIHDIISLINPE